MLQKLKYRKSQICAACVQYGGQEKYAWIITRFERAIDDGKYIVRDEYANHEQLKTYTVEPNRIIPFPIRDAVYEPGERILALWCDQETGEWTTKFYQAVVLKADRCAKLTIQYNESDTTVEIDHANVTKFPESCDLLDGNQLHVSEPISDVESEPVVPNPPSRRVEFTWTPTATETSSSFSKLDDNEFSKLCEASKINNRVYAQKGTPLIDFLEDEVLFPKERWRLANGGSINIIPFKKPNEN